MGKGIFGKIIGLIIVLLVIGTLINSFYVRPGEEIKIKKFSSQSELEDFVKESSYGLIGGGLFSTRVAEASTGEQAGKAADYSTTNIQVEGVDEADIVKNDDKYIYAVSGKDVLIVDAYPADTARIISSIELDGYPSEIFINGDKLVVFGQNYGGEYGIMQRTESVEIGVVPPWYSNPKTFIHVYDVSNREAPVLVRNVSVDGNYYDSRMIGDYVYAVVNKNVRTDPIDLPRIYEGREVTVPATDIYYFNFPDYSYVFTNIVAINIQNSGEELSSQTLLLGYSSNMYVSESNIYITHQKRMDYVELYNKIVEEAIIPSVSSDTEAKIEEIMSSSQGNYEKMQSVSDALREYLESLGPQEAASVMKSIDEKTEDLYKELAKEMEKTIVHKISISNGNVEYKTSGEVPGYTLNQFSMDEYNGYFRVATTTNSWQEYSANHLYVLDSDMKIVGRLENLAEGERIYSVRFIGNKGFMVTFRQIDPLFVMDLENPEQPRVLGFLKIPGVSDYLHPYDETHIIGVGRDANDEGRIKGMKLSLFDVSDVSNPTEVSKYIIGERGTYSEALYDHKAFLFSKSNSLLVLPVSLSDADKWNSWQGAYVFNLDLENGFQLKGRVTHADSNETYEYSSQIRRSLYIDNVLYTISNKMIKMNDLDSMDEIKGLDLPNESDRIIPL